MPHCRRISASCDDISRLEEAKDSRNEGKTDYDNSFTFNRLGASLNCDMCVNYESRLQQYQETERRLRQQLNTLQSLNEQYKMELSAERLQRKDVESMLLNLRESVEKQQQDLDTVFKALKGRIIETKQMLEGELNQVRTRMVEVHNGRKRAEENLANLQRKYDTLLGRHKEKADQLQREVINLPQTVEELHLMCLQLREELIESRLTEEHLEESLRSDLIFVKSQLESELQSKGRLEASLTESVNNLRTELAVAQSQLNDQQVLLQWKADAEKQLERLQGEVDQLKGALQNSKNGQQKLQEELRDSHTRAHSLQKELDNCVQVQRDFVHLSQSLQMQLEKIRQSEHEVRWEEDDDVIVCRSCKHVFNKQRRKMHCRHCGRIFCETCLFRTVPSGSQRKPAKVCEVCHTLLVRDTAPYFSVQVPQSQLGGFL